MKLLEGKTALITGAARGIGKALAIRFAQEGANIAFTDLTIDENGKATEAEIAAYGVKCVGYASNAADFAQTEEVVKQVVEDFGRIDILVNNAGITKDGPDDAYDRISVGCSYRSQPQKRVQLHPRCSARNDASALRFDYQHGISCRRTRQCRSVELRSFKSRSYRPCQEHRSGK